jgi:hypothetical protein
MIQQLIDRGVIRPVVAAMFPLAQACKAFERGIAGHTRGKIVLPFSPATIRRNRVCACRHDSEFGKGKFDN